MQTIPDEFENTPELLAEKTGIPVAVVDYRFSRRKSIQLLYLPGENKPKFFANFAQLITFLREKQFESSYLVAEDTRIYTDLCVIFLSTKQMKVSKNG